MERKTVRAISLPYLASRLRMPLHEGGYMRVTQLGISSTLFKITPQREIKVKNDQNSKYVVGVGWLDEAKMD